MAVPSQAAPSSRPRCRNCGRFVARGAELCSSCSTPVAIDAARAHLGLLEPQVRATPEPVPSESTATPGPRVALAIAPPLRVVRAGRTRCATCGRFIAGGRTHCDRCEQAIATQLPLQETIAPPKPVVSAVLRTAPPPETWFYQRTRSDFVVPRPSELHPDPASDAEHRFMAARAAIVARAAQSNAENESTWWAAVRSAAMRQRVALAVVAASAATGVALAMLMATR